MRIPCEFNKTFRRRRRNKTVRRCKQRYTIRRGRKSGGILSTMVVPAVVSAAAFTVAGFGALCYSKMIFSTTKHLPNNWTYHTYNKGNAKVTVAPATATRRGRGDRDGGSVSGSSSSLRNLFMMAAEVRPSEEDLADGSTAKSSSEATDNGIQICGHTYGYPICICKHEEGPFVDAKFTLDISDFTTDDKIYIGCIPLSIFNLCGINRFNKKKTPKNPDSIEMHNPKETIGRNLIKEIEHTGNGDMDFIHIHAYRSQIEIGDIYSILGLSSDATDSNVRDAWREKVRQLHPDKEKSKKKQDASNDKCEGKSEGKMEGDGESKRDEELKALNAAYEKYDEKKKNTKFISFTNDYQVTIESQDEFVKLTITFPKGARIIDSLLVSQIEEDSAQFRSCVVFPIIKEIKDEIASRVQFYLELNERFGGSITYESNIVDSDLTCNFSVLPQYRGTQELSAYKKFELTNGQKPDITKWKDFSYETPPSVNVGYLTDVSSYILPYYLAVFVTSTRDDTDDCKVKINIECNEYTSFNEALEKLVGERENPTTLKALQTLIPYLGPNNALSIVNMLSNTMSHRAPRPTPPSPSNETLLITNGAGAGATGASETVSKGGRPKRTRRRLSGVLKTRRCTDK